MREVLNPGLAFNTPPIYFLLKVISDKLHSGTPVRSETFTIFVL